MNKATIRWAIAVVGAGLLTFLFWLLATKIIFVALIVYAFNEWFSAKTEINTQLFCYGEFILVFIVGVAILRPQPK